MTDVFISHSHEDRDVARRHVSGLEAACLAGGWNAVLDWRR